VLRRIRGFEDWKGGKEKKRWVFRDFYGEESIGPCVHVGGGEYIVGI
jgi:hypothetical protein